MLQENQSERTEQLQALKKLSELKPGKFYRALILDWSIIAVSLILSGKFPNVIVLLLCGFIIGNRQQALAVLAHESVHFLVHRNRKLNDLVGMVFCAWPLGSFLTGFRKFHLAHHKHVGTEHDPELKIYEFGNWTLPRSFPSLRQFVSDLFGLGIRDLFQMMSLFPPTKKWEYLGVLVTWAVLFTVLAVFGAPWLILMWIIPLVTVFWALARFRIWTEHRGIESTHRFEMNWIVRELFYPHGIGVHYEHHQWSFIPFYHLLQARKLDATTPVVPLGDVLNFLKSGDAAKYEKESGQTRRELDFRPAEKQVS